MINPVSFCFSSLGTTPLTATAAMPGSSMKIFYGEPTEGTVAENVKIGDPLSLVVTIDDQDIYGMHITECLVRDGMGWTEQDLINEEGYVYLSLTLICWQLVSSCQCAGVPSTMKLCQSLSTAAARQLPLSTSRRTSSPTQAASTTNAMSSSALNMPVAVIKW